MTTTAGRTPPGPVRPFAPRRPVPLAQRRREWLAAQDDCLIAIDAGRPVPTTALQALPPWRAVLLARVAARAGVALQDGTVDQIRAEARRAGGGGILGDWWAPRG